MTSPKEVAGERTARLASLGVVLLWSGSGVFTKLATGRFSALQAAWWEALCGLVFVSTLAWRARIGVRLSGLTLLDFVRLTVLALLAHTLYYTFLFLGFAARHEVETMALNYTWALFMVLFGVMINRVRLTWYRAASVVLGAVGAILVVIPDPARVKPFSWGSVAGLAAGLSFGLFTPLTVRWKYDPRLVTCWMMGVSLVAFSAALFLFDVPLRFEWVGLAGAAYLGVGVDGIGYVLWQRANRVLTPWVLAAWACLIPMLNLSLLKVIFGFSFPRPVLLGAALIVGGIALQQLSVIANAVRGARAEA